MADDLLTLAEQANKTNIQKQEDIKEVETNSNETNIVSETTIEVTKDESVSSVDNTEDITNAEDVSDTENTKNTENTIIEDKVQEKQIIKEGTDTVDKPKTKDEEITETEQVGIVQGENTKIKNEEVNIKAKKTDTDIYIDELDYSSYRVVTDIPFGNTKVTRLCKITKKGVVPLTNALPVIKEKVSYKDGENTTTKYKLKLELLDNQEKIGGVEIDERELSKLIQVMDSCGTGKIINHEENNDKKMKEVAQTIARVSMKESTIFTHTGFTKINGNTVFLFHNGNIGADNENIITDLEYGELKMSRYCMTNKEFDAKEAFERELSLLKVTNPSIIFPLLATTFISPLYTLLQEEDIHPNYVLLVLGKTGVLKSSIVAVLLSHFGNFDRDNFPATFRDTLNTIEKRASVCKDCLFVIDDYKPEARETEQEKIMEQIFAMFGDRVGRGRMKPDGTLRKSCSAQGMGIVTGERMPKVPQGRIARAMKVEIKKGDINLDELTKLQQNKEQLAFVMKKYIKWIIDNDETIRRKSKEILNTYSTTTSHLRTAEYVSILMIGIVFWLDFLEENNAINSTQKEDLKSQAYQTLIEAGNAMTLSIEEENPIEIFFDTISELISTGRIYFTDKQTGVAENVSSGKHVGYVDDNYYYLLPDTIYNEVAKACSSQFLMSPKELWTNLKNENYIVVDKQNRPKIRMTEPITKIKTPMVLIRKQKWQEIMGNEEKPAP